MDDFRFKKLEGQAKPQGQTVRQTAVLRWAVKKQGGVAVLQQAWVSDEGEIFWKDVPREIV